MSAEITIRDILNNADPNELEDCLRKLGFGNMCTVLKRVFTGLTGAASFDLTAIDATGETVGKSNPNRLAAAYVLSLRVVTAGTANTQGTYLVSDVAGTIVTPTNNANAGICRISDDGKTLTFGTADVTAFTIQYIPRGLVATSTKLTA